jgi:hypothetical protein
MDSQFKLGHYLDLGSPDLLWLSADGFRARSLQFCLERDGLPLCAHISPYFNDTRRDITTMPTLFKF